MKTGILASLLLCLAACSAADSPAPAPPPAPDERAAIAALRAVNQAQEDFIRRTRRYAQRYDELIAEHLLDAEPTRAATGYDFLLLPSPDAVHYTVTATPAAAGGRHFFTDETGVIRTETGKPAGAASPEI